MRSPEPGTKSKRNFIKQCRSEVLNAVNGWSSQMLSGRSSPTGSQMSFLELIQSTLDKEGPRGPLYVRADFNQSMEFLIDRISRVVDFCEFYSIAITLANHDHFIGLYNERRLWFQCTLPPDIRTEFLATIERIMNAQFSKKYEFLWEAALTTRAEHDWYRFLEDQSNRQSNQKDTFRMYWTILKRFEKLFINYEQPFFDSTRRGRFDSMSFKDQKDVIEITHIEKLSDRSMFAQKQSKAKRIDLRNWLWQKCSAFRIKIKVNRTEREMIQFIKRVWINSKLSNGSLIQIDSVENFVRSHFLCKDSRHETKLYPHKFSVPTASDFIHFIRYLFHHEKFFDLDFEREIVLMEIDKLIEVQLWLEFVFYNHSGFSESSIETYFINKENQGRDLTNFDYIISKYPSGFEGYFSAFHMLYRTNDNKVKSDLNA